jgi:hypothetical protein
MLLKICAVMNDGGDASEEILRGPDWHRGFPVLGAVLAVPDEDGSWIRTCLRFSNLSCPPPLSKNLSHFKERDFSRIEVYDPESCTSHNLVHAIPFCLQAPRAINFPPYHGEQSVL